MRAEPVPIRIAIVPAAVAAVIVETWLAVRLLVLDAVPDRVEVTEERRRATGPTESHVPLWSTTARLVDGFTFASLRTRDPTPVS